MSDDTAPVALGAPGPQGSVPIVRAEGLTKTHHGEGAPVQAVRGVDLTVQPGSSLPSPVPPAPENPPFSIS